MNGQSNLSRAIVDRFDKAAPRYSRQATMQECVAKSLVARAARKVRNPEAILDIGGGTGFVTVETARRWPEARLTALDASPAMLVEAQHRTPQLKLIAADATEHTPSAHYDVIFSSMMLHWLPEPAFALSRWQGWLKPGGTMFVALLTEGSFQEWRDLCRKNNLDDGLWPMPPHDFAAECMGHCEHETMPIAYPTAQAFLRRLKDTGAATPRSGHTPITPGAMRQILTRAPRPFGVTYRILYLEIPALPGA